MPVVLVEGITDRIALEAVAAKLASTSPRRASRSCRSAARRRSAGPRPSTRANASVGLCDAGEERWFRRVLDDAAYVCAADLEDELIRALGPARVEEIVAAQGELETFRNFQNQPAWRGRPVQAQLRRWLQNGGRYLRYPPLLVEILEPERIPRPLVGVLGHG